MYQYLLTMPQLGHNCGISGPHKVIFLGFLHFFLFWSLFYIVCIYLFLVHIFAIIICWLTLGVSLFLSHRWLWPQLPHSGWLVLHCLGLSLFLLYSGWLALGCYGSFCRTMGDWCMWCLASASTGHLAAMASASFVVQWMTGAWLPWLQHLFDIAYKLNTHSKPKDPLLCTACT